MIVIIKFSKIQNFKLLHNLIIKFEKVNFLLSIYFIYIRGTNEKREQQRYETCYF